MPIIDHVDPISRRIYLSATTVGVDLLPIDIFHEMVSLRAATPTLRPYDVFLTAAGHIPKSAGKFTERIVTCMSGTRIVPYDVTQILAVRGTIITDIGTEGSRCFDRTGLVSKVDIDYQPPQVEIIQVSLGSGLDAIQASQLKSIFDITGGGGAQIGTQLIMYAADNSTIVATFNLYDANGNLTSDMSKVIKQERV